MQQLTFYKWRPTMETGFASLLFLLVTGVNVVANWFPGTLGFYLLYQGILILGIGIFIPLWNHVRSNELLDSIGLTLRNWKRALLMAVLLIAFSVPWRFTGLELFQIELDKLLSTCISLSMTSLFEEVFFRGFLQTRFEKAFGMLPALLLSGLTFSLYHIGYPAYQNLHLLLVLFWVGLFFAIAFRTTNNILTSFLVNLPHAILSFLQNGTYMSTVSAAVSGAAVLIALSLIFYFSKFRIK